MLLLEEREMEGEVERWVCISLSPCTEWGGGRLVPIHPPPIPGLSTMGFGGYEMTLMGEKI